MSKYILLTNGNGDTIAIHASKVAYVETNCGESKTHIVLDGGLGLYVREPVANVLEMLNAKDAPHPSQYR